MDRRAFVRGAAGAGMSAWAAGLPNPEGLGAGQLGDEASPVRRAIPSRDPSALIMDAMGELRPIYEPPLVRD